MTGNVMLLKRFIAERDAALLSMDEKKIRAMVREHNGVEMPADRATFWVAVHKARSAAATLPREEQRRSIEWLKARGFEHFGDEP